MIGSPCFLGWSASVQLPSVSDHQFEVLIIINVGGDVVVVLSEFIQRHSGVVSARVLDGGVDLECVEEVSENFFTSLLSSLDIRVVGRIVDTSHIVFVNFTRSVSVEFGESLSNKLFSSGVHLSNNMSKELVEVHTLVSIDIKGSKGSPEVVISDLESVVLEDLPELGPVERA